MSFNIKADGRTHSVDVDGDTPLLWVLRDLLGLTGTEFGCGRRLGLPCSGPKPGEPGWLTRAAQRRASAA